MSLGTFLSYRAKKRTITKQEQTGLYLSVGGGVGEGRGEGGGSSRRSASLYVQILQTCPVFVLNNLVSRSGEAAASELVLSRDVLAWLPWRHDLVVNIAALGRPQKRR